MRQLALISFAPKRLKQNDIANSSRLIAISHNKLQKRSFRYISDIDNVTDTVEDERSGIKITALKTLEHNFLFGSSYLCSLIQI